MVMADGFAWNGQTHDSLSKIAFAITGTKWNGPRFLGLRDKEDPGHEGALGQAGPLCDLYKGLHRARSGIQLAGWQHDAASAYIKSQAHAGWTLIRSRYDDGGYSGGSTDRPDPKGSWMISALAKSMSSLSTKSTMSQAEFSRRN